MDISDDKHAEYLIDRFRKLGTGTTRWSIILLIGLIYTLLVSIYPRHEFISNSVTIIHKFTHFDSLTTNKKKIRKSFVSVTSDSFSSLNYKIGRNVYDTSKTDVRNQYENLLSTLRKAEALKKDSGRFRLRLLLDSTYRLKGKAKKNIKDTIKKYYLPIDILIAMSDIQKEKALSQKDSLLNHADISFNVPELHTLDFGFRVGLVVWMILLLILLLYLFSVRISLIRYLKDVYFIQKKSFKSNIKEWKKLDLQAPFWLAPINFKESDEKPVFQALVGWKFTGFHNVMGVAFLLLIVALQLYVGWLSWHVSVLRYFENTWFQIIDVFLICCTVFLFLLWLQPVVFSAGFGQTEHFNFKRREVIKLGLSSLVFLLLSPSVGRLVPIMKGKPLQFNRRKSKLKTNSKLELEDGFYSYKKNKVVMVYYLSGGKSPSMKNIPPANFKALSGKLKKIDIFEIIEDPKMHKYHIPYWPSVMEKEAYLYAAKMDFISAIRILLFSLAYSVGGGSRYIRRSDRIYAFGSTNQTGFSKAQNRLSCFLAGLILRAEVKLPESEKRMLASIIKEKQLLIPGEVLDRNFMDFYENDSFYTKKWQESKSLAWHLPQRKRAKVT